MSNHTCRLCGGIDDNGSIRQVVIWNDQTDTICGTCWDHRSRYVPLSLNQLNEAMGIGGCGPVRSPGRHLRDLWLEAVWCLQNQ